jgi:hypothetical protein
LPVGKTPVHSASISKLPPATRLKSRVRAIFHFSYTLSL